MHKVFLITLLLLSFASPTYAKPHLVSKVFIEPKQAAEILEPLPETETKWMTPEYYIIGESYYPVREE